MSEQGNAAEQTRAMDQDETMALKLKAQAEPELKAWEVTYTAQSGHDRTLVCLTDGEDTFPTAEDFAAMIQNRTGQARVWVVRWVQVPH